MVTYAQKCHNLQGSFSNGLLASTVGYQLGLQVYRFLFYGSTIEKFLNHWCTFEKLSLETDKVRALFSEVRFKQWLIENFNSHTICI